MIAGGKGKEYLVRLDVFTGPLDLLLHLVQQEEVSIYDIPIARITAQYLEYMTQLDELDVDLASDFLVLAATLLQIKARLLVPRPSLVGETEERTRETVDPRQELIGRLIIYKKYKGAAEELQKRLAIQECCFSRWPGFRPLPARVVSPLSPLPPALLAEAYQELLAMRQKEKKTHYVAPENISLRSCVKMILGRLKPGSRMTFRELLGEKPSRLETIITFLALLELARLGVVTLFQVRLFGPLELWRRPKTRKEASPLMRPGEVKQT